MERYKFNPITRTLVMSAGFARAISDIRSDEYNLYKQMLADIPDLKVERKTHEKPTSYIGQNGKRTTCYPTKKLSYKRMEKFMEALPENNKYLDEYNKLRKYAEAMCLSPYAPVAQWFMAQFPKFRENPLFYVNNSVEVIDFAEYLDSANKKAS